MSIFEAHLTQTRAAAEDCRPLLDEFKNNQNAFISNTMKTMIGDPEDWLAQFNALNNLRVINKYHKEVLFESLE